MKTKTKIIHPAFALFAFACFAFLSGLSASAATNYVSVGAFPGLPDFNPRSVTIFPGDRVKWFWRMSLSGHSTKSVDGLWNSGVRSQGATFYHSFNSVGIFRYRCTVDGQMGKVIVTPPTPDPATVADFNGDGHPDFVLRNAATRQTVIWHLNNNVFVSGSVGPTLPAGWGLKGARNFNADNHPDYALFKSATRQTAIWYLSGVSGSTYAGNAVAPLLNVELELVAVADFYGNAVGKPDFVVYNAGTRGTAIWNMNNNVNEGAAPGPTLPAGWSLRGVADFNGDNHPDYALFNPATRQTAIWYLSGVVSGSIFALRSAGGPTPPSGWALVATADFNGDGKPDYVLYNAVNRKTLIWYLNNNVFVSAALGPTLPAGWSLVGQ